MTNKQEFKQAWLLGVKLNNLKHSHLQKLHAKSKVAIDKWLYVDDRYPDFQAVYELYKLIVALHGTVPIELRRIVQRSNNRVADFINSLDGYNPMGSDSIVGVRKQQGRKSACYYEFQGEVLTIAEISQRMERHVTTVYTRIRRKKLNGIHGANVDFLLNNRQELK